MEIRLNDTEIRKAASEGMEAFVGLFVRAISEAAGGEITAQAMEKLTPEQLTLWGYWVMRDEVMEGGFIQLIHNGWGPFFFENPFARALKLWGLRDLSKLVYEARRLYMEHGEALTRDCSDEEFMALYEQFPEFDPLDDDFVEHEAEYTEAIARHIDTAPEAFVTIVTTSDGSEE